MRITHVTHPQNADRRSLRGLVGRYLARWKEGLPDYGNRVVRSGPSRWACCPLAGEKIKSPIYCGILTPHRPMIIVTHPRWAQTFQPRSPFRPVSVGLMSISHVHFPSRGGTGACNGLFPQAGPDCQSVPIASRISPRAPLNSANWKLGKQIIGVSSCGIRAARHRPTIPHAERTPIHHQFVWYRPRGGRPAAAIYHGCGVAGRDLRGAGRRRRAI